MTTPATIVKCLGCAGLVLTRHRCKRNLATLQRSTNNQVHVIPCECECRK